MTTRVSVAMATYNGEKYIKEQLDSILAQISGQDEIVISDDKSTDSTIDIINSYNDNRIRVVSGPQNGIIANFENAILHSKGEIIFLSDQDDIWVENKLKRVLSEFENNPNRVLIMHDAKVVNETLEKNIYESFFEFRKSKNGKWYNIYKNSFMGCCMAFRRELVERFIPIPRDIQMHDQWIGLISEIEFGRTLLLKDKLILYRRHRDCASDFEHNSLMKMIRNRLLLIYRLNQRKRGVRKENGKEK